MSLGDKIAELRRQRGWSQENLAERLGVTRQSVSKWESGASVPDLDKIIGLSELFGVTTDYLIKCEGAAEAAPSEEDPSVDQHSRYVTASMAREFIELTSANAPKAALAVALFVLSPICLILLSALSELPGAVISTTSELNSRFSSVYWAFTTGATRNASPNMNSLATSYPLLSEGKSIISALWNVPS